MTNWKVSVKHTTRAEKYVFGATIKMGYWMDDGWLMI